MMRSKIKSWLFKKIISSNFFKSYKEEVKRSLEMIAKINNTTTKAMLQNAEADTLDKQNQAESHLSRGKEIIATADKKYADALAKITSDRENSYYIAAEENKIGRNLNNEAAKESAAIKNLS